MPMDRRISEAIVSLVVTQGQVITIIAQALGAGPSDISSGFCLP